jgi:hypothetical protein
MRKKFYLFFFVAFSVSAQIELKIDSISTTDTKPKKREFAINYHIKNLTNKEISFFLIPNSLIAHSASSLTLFPVYKIFQNGVFEDIDGPFYERAFKEQDDLEDLNDSDKKKKLIEEITRKYTLEYQVLIENYKKNGGKSTDDMWIFKNQKLLQHIETIKPNEIKNFIIQTNWNKKRYYKIDDNEYYLNENDKFEFELSLYLDKSNRKNSLSPEEFSTINNNENFIQGTFTSNKMEINFKE